MPILGSTASRKAERRKKPDELLSSVVRETAVSAAVELLRANTRFVLPNGTSTVMLLLDVRNIGGLSKRHGRDEAKGSIVELIGSDRIQTVATATMLTEEVFGIIPNEETLERMSEFSLLTNATYHWAAVYQRPNGQLVIDPFGETTFDKARAVSAGKLTLQSIASPEVWRDHGGSGGGDSTSSLVAEAADDGEGDGDEIFNEGYHENEPDFGPISDEEETVVFLDEISDDDVVDEVPDEASAFYDAPEAEIEDEEAVSGLDEYDGPDDEVEHPEDEAEQVPVAAVSLPDQAAVRDIVARRFLSEDLDLEILFDEFEATFAIGAPAIQIEVPEGAHEWLGDQVAQLTRQANAAIAQARFAHEDELRAMFVNLSGKHAENVIREVAQDREGSRYKTLKDSADKAHRDRQEDKDQVVRTRKAEILQSYEQQAAELGRQAASQAELQFKERNRARMEREQSDAVAEIESALESGHTHDLMEILRVRRSSAQLMMQVGRTRIFEVLAEQQQAFLSSEASLLAEWTSTIQRIVDDNRKADVVQYEALAEQQRIADEVGRLQAEHDQRVEAMRSEQADRVRRMEADFESERAKSITSMNERERTWNDKLASEKEKTTGSQAQVQTLLGQLQGVEAATTARFEARLAEVQADKDGYAHELKRASESHSRSSKTLIAFMVVLTLLGATAGFIAGMGYFSSLG